MNPYKEILENLKWYTVRHGKHEQASMFSHLIKLMGEEDFNKNFIMTFDHYEDKGGYDEFYFNYHKQFRQCDMYDIQGAEFIGFKSYEKDKEKWDKRAEDKDGEIVRNYLMFSIGGHLDMLFWNMIHVGTEIWDFALKKTHEDYKESLTEKI